MEFEFEPGHSAPVVRRKAPDDNHRYRVTCAGFGLAAPNPAPQKNGVFAIPPHKFWPPQDGSILPKPEPGGKFYGATYVFSKAAPQGGACAGQQYWPEDRSHLTEGIMALRKGHGGGPARSKASAKGGSFTPPLPLDAPPAVSAIPRSHNYACGPQCYCMKYADAALGLKTPPKDRS